MINKRVLVTGSNGQLGSEIRQLSDRTDFDFIFTDIEELDLTNPSYVEAFFDKENIDYCINCAAYTAVDKAESEPEITHKINVEAVKNLAMACSTHDVSLIHISTDFVFNGKSNIPYTENMEPDPISIYGRSKLEGEQKALNHNLNTLVIRTAWLYSSFGGNFVKTMLQLGRDKDSLKVVVDQVGTPTYARDLAHAIIKIIQKLSSGHKNVNEITGIYHFSNEGIASWYDFAMEIFRQKKIEIEVNPVRTMAFPTPATRPQYSVMDKSRIKEVFGLKIPYWKDSLATCLMLID